MDSAKVTTGLRTGFVRYKIKASDGSNNLGTYIAQAVVYKQTKTGMKTWMWTVKSASETADTVRDIFSDSTKEWKYKDTGYPDTLRDIFGDTLTVLKNKLTGFADTTRDIFGDTLTVLKNRLLGFADTTRDIFGDTLTVLKNKLTGFPDTTRDVFGDSAKVPFYKVNQYLDEAISGIDDNPWDDDTEVIQKLRNQFSNLISKDIYVKTNGNNDSSGLSWAGAKVNVDSSINACTGATAYIVHVAPGTYTSQFVTLDVNNVWLKGAGKEQTILQNAGSVINITGTGCKVSGLTIDGAMGTTTVGIYIQGVGIHAEIFDNYITDVGRGIYLIGDNSFIHHNTVFKCSLDCIYLFSADFCEISDNILDSLLYTASNPIALTSSNNNKIIHNYIRFSGGHGIECIGCNSNFIADNYVWAPGTTAPFVTASSSKQSYVGNHSKSSNWTTDTTNTIEQDLWGTKVKGGSIGSCTTATTVITVINRVHTYATDTTQANLIVADSTLIMDEIKNLNAWNPANGIDSVRKVYLLDSLEQVISASANCQGVGVNTVILELLSSSDSSGVSGVLINIDDSTTGGFVANGVTGNAGVDTFSLDDGSYTVQLQKTPWAITSPVYPNITTDTTLTYYATQINVGSPSASDMCRIWCYATDINANLLTGARLYVWIGGEYGTIWNYDSSLVISPYAITSVASGSNGLDSVSVYRSLGSYGIKSSTGNTVKMWIELRNSAGQLVNRVKTEIPASSSWEIQF